ncbi:hypothetical protein NDU88_007664 [Pleurodeles waltl]|uniref:Secreted protein n=1 Tax=Pleurodeles waltl TaxID=8319 RepID=A0AAV7N2R2_PLEWA|nr:hypothetical protein NDU88_007664 [Pleurodeles waltl]
MRESVSFRVLLLLMCEQKSFVDRQTRVRPPSALRSRSCCLDRGRPRPPVPRSLLSWQHDEQPDPYKMKQESREDTHFRNKAVTVKCFSFFRGVVTAKRDCKSVKGFILEVVIRGKRI